MADEQTTQKGEQSSRDVWRELGEQFQELGKSLATAIRNAMETEENRKRLQSLEAGLKSMASEVAKAIEQAAESPEGQKVRQEIEKTAESARIASQQAMEEARPQLAAALRQINEELRKLTQRLEQQNSATPKKE